MLLVKPKWPFKSGIPTFLRMSIEQPQILPQDHQFLVNLHKGSHPLVIEKSPKLAVWTASSLGYLREEF